ncbi:lectin [Gymnopilus junonius]|uniref:Lectin n=1 Tax=Gymnopilus junonius TaxID=109634 RepID=A0A9P5TLV9_GYMJU|nr:lectin [Gymnopilus junonius]
MSYSIALQLYQTNTNAYFHPVEQTVWNFANGGTWSRTDEVRTLTMGGSGTSGTMRFVSDTGENFLVAVGVHNFARWCDIVTNDQTGTVINPQYYGGGRDAVREQQFANCNAINSKNRHFKLNYTVANGNDLKADIIIC